MSLFSPAVNDRRLNLLDLIGSDAFLSIQPLNLRVQLSFRLEHHALGMALA